jgi:hypothetical protein
MSPTGKPWERLSPHAARLVERERAAIAAEILDSIAREIPAYTRPMEGAFGDAVRAGVDQALERFVAMVREPGTEPLAAQGRAYFDLGRGEVAAGRSIGALLAAYRLGAQIAWRRIAAASIRDGLDQRESNLLAEAIFAYIDELSAESAEGYAQAQAELAGELDTRRGELIDQLTRGRIGTDPRALAEAAAGAGWTVPAELAVLTWHADLGRAPVGRLPQGSIAHGDANVYTALISEPGDQARREQLLGAFARIRAGLGSAAPPHLAFQSYAHSRAMLALAEDSEAAGIVCADDNRNTLIVRSDRLLVERILRDRLRGLDDETPASRARLTATLLAWLRNDGNTAATAAELHIHAQTLRYRLARLRELLGGAIDDAEVRYELEFALRATASSCSSSQVLHPSPPA